MRIEIFSKNHALLHTRVLPAGTPVPRVGDAITALDDVGYTQGVQTLLVHEVEYLLEGAQLAAVVRCHVCEPSATRLLVLREQGWLPPGDD